MKKNLFLITLLSVLLFSCDSDDDSTTVADNNAPENTEQNTTIESEVEVEQEVEVEEEIQAEVIAAEIIRISQVNPSTNQVTFRNFGNVETNIGDYFLCLGPGTYRRISSATTSSTVLAPNAELTVNYNMNAMADGLSVFTTNSFTSSDPEILIDYVQWGEANQARVNQAVAAGRWNNSSEFIATATSYNFNGEAAQFGVSFWAGN